MALVSWNFCPLNVDFNFVKSQKSVGANFVNKEVLKSINRCFAINTFDRECLINWSIFMMEEQVFG